MENGRGLMFGFGGDWAHYTPSRTKRTRGTEPLLNRKRIPQNGAFACSLGVSCGLKGDTGLQRGVLAITVSLLERLYAPLASKA